LRVRYVLDAGARHLIRCKLNAPIIEGKTEAPPYWEYDGYLRTLDENVFWKFVKREALGTDFFDFITNNGIPQRRDGNVAWILSGAYLTTGQDPLHSIEQGEVILRGLLLEEIAGEDNQIKTEAEIIADWMHSTATVLNPDKPETRPEWESVNALWQEYGPHKQDGAVRS
jgi:hypothetical protein